MNETNNSAFMEFMFLLEKATVNKMYGLSATGNNKNRKGELGHSVWGQS